MVPARTTRKSPQHHLDARKTPSRIKCFRDLNQAVLLKRNNPSQWNSCQHLLKTLLQPEVQYDIKQYVDENWLLEEDKLE